MEPGANIEAKDNNGWTLLHYAASKGHKEIIEFLVNEKKANINARTTSDSKKPIHVAAKEGYQEIVDFFLGKRMRVDDADNDKWTPLHYAAAYNHLELSKFLVGQRANIEAKNKDNKTPLDLACKRNHMKMVDFLAQAKLDQDLITAAAEGSLQTVKNLIERGADIEAKDEKGWTPLHYAARYNHLELCEFLLGQHANIEAKNKNNKTPLDLARERNHMEIVSSLMQPQLGQKMTAVAEETIQKVKNLIEQSANIEAKDMDISNDNLKSDRRASSNDSLESDGDTAPGTTVKEVKVESYAKSRKVQRQ
ncbi:hypothetical protein OUY_02205 [Wolbachia endosymbiont of Leptopilina clavipes]|uniref:ankyrin repeat domain-containing protein n=1 Tax=Wolbachia endosymbiont of Leptopilina clavipes TaxID=260213 RepID=UPI001118C8C5|nr:hypothetical protein OUY_02205 [Wolbachia endosymbiont of Leptopilina clavipes]